MAKGSDITHNSAGRINVEPGNNSVTLRLFQWGLKPDASLTREEVDKLQERLAAASAKVWPKRRPPAAESDDHDYA